MTSERVSEPLRQQTMGQRDSGIARQSPLPGRNWTSCTWQKNATQL